MQYEDENGVNEPSRRRLLKGIGALALAGSCPVAHAQKTQSAPGTLSPDARNEKQPFYGEHQAGILTPQQAAMMLVAFDVLASDKADLERLFRLLTQRFAFLTQGGAAPETPNPRLPPLDSGILGGYIASDNLTITLSVGHSLFDERFGLTPQMPKKLQKMTRFPNDSLDAALCHGDVLLQICANTQDTVIHALRDIIKHTPDLLSVRWKREGFISDHAARSKGKETPINLLGFKDGTANPDSQNDKLMQQVVWVTADQQEPAWTIGGSYQAVRLIQFRVEFWDRTPLKEQQTIFGRDKQTGAPLGMQHEHDVPDYASDPEGKVEIAPFAYMRGRTFENAVVILDEAQNVTAAQMKMFLTRLGENVTVIVNGDITQCDLPRGVRSGLSDALERFEEDEMVGIVRFGKEDCVRSALCQRTLHAYS